MSEYFENAIRRKGDVPSDLIEKVSAMADANLARYYGLLRSTDMEGMENLISAIHRSTFSICRSSSHHHYTTGTMEHCLGVYDEMMKNNKDGRFCERDIILVALLHDVGKGRSREFSFEKGDHHPTRSMKIVRRYLKNVPSEVLYAIRYHQHHSHDHPLQDLVCKADHKDASKCNDARNYLIEVYSNAKNLSENELYEESDGKWILDTRLQGLGAMRRFFLGLADKIEILPTEDSEKLQNDIRKYVAQNLDEYIK